MILDLALLFVEFQLFMWINLTIHKLTSIREYWILKGRVHIRLDYIIFGLN